MLTVQTCDALFIHFLQQLVVEQVYLCGNAPLMEASKQQVNLENETNMRLDEDRCE